MVTDRQGSPLEFYTSLGQMVKRVVRTPYGHVREDTSPHLHAVPIGFGGAIYDPGLATNSILFCFLFVKKSLICLEDKSLG